MVFFAFWWVTLNCEPHVVIGRLVVVAWVVAFVALIFDVVILLIVEAPSDRVAEREVVLFDDVRVDGVLGRVALRELAWSGSRASDAYRLASYISGVFCREQFPPMRLRLICADKCLAYPLACATVRVEKGVPKFGRGQKWCPFA